MTTEIETGVVSPMHPGSPQKLQEAEKDSPPEPPEVGGTHQHLDSDFRPPEH